MMKDVYFDGYNNKRKRNSNEDTSEIPLTSSEKDFQDRINQQRYEEILKKQNMNSNSSQYGSDNYGVPIRKNRNNYTDIDSGRRNQRSNVKVRNNSDNRKSNQPKNVNSNKKKKKGCGCGTTFICLLLVATLLCGCTLGYIYSLCNKTNYVKSESNAFISSSELKSSSDVYNVLLIGTDKKSEGNSRSDTMMLVSVDNKNKTLKFTSFMRDMWVDIPGHSSAKMNAACTYGGAQLVMDTIEYNFKIDIDDYIMVDFEMFEKLIDSLGGVTVDITESEASFINRTSHAKVTAGENTLNGDYALIYCRIRKLDSDFMRTQRQRKVMSAIFEQVKSQSIFKTFSAMSNILPLVTTDINSLKMMSLIMTSAKYLSYGNDQFRVPEDGEYASRQIEGQSALVPDLETNTADLQKFIYG